jgi:hypothetical protein
MGVDWSICLGNAVSVSGAGENPSVAAHVRKHRSTAASPLGSVLANCVSSSTTVVLRPCLIALYTATIPTAAAWHWSALAANGVRSPTVGRWRSLVACVTMPTTLLRNRFKRIRRTSWKRTFQSGRLRPYAAVKACFPGKR